MKIQSIPSKNLIIKSNLPASDYVINPYIGCSHGCRYCYASFMKRFSRHTEDWGSFIDIKDCPKLKLPHMLSGKTILLSSVTDAYQPIEQKTGLTHHILQQLAQTEGKIEILTKSHLVTRDIDLFVKIPNIHIGISMNTLEDSFRKDMEPGASPIPLRLNALKQLATAGIYTYLFVAPIFPEITDLRALLTETAPYIKEVCFENLNLRGSQIPWMLSYIEENYPSLLPLYTNIYVKRNISYWDKTEALICSLATKYPMKFTNYLYHDKLKKK